MKTNFIFSDRVLAFMYDLVLIGLIFMFVFFGTIVINKHFLNWSSLNQNILMISLGSILYLIFFGLVPIKLNGTIGKTFTDLEVVPTNGKITFGRWVFREFIFKHLFYGIGIGIIIDLLFILFKRKTTHDYFLKTTVLKR